MSKKFKVWLDSGANIHSKREITFTLEDIGYDDESWDELSDKEKEDEMREVAFERSDWGFVEIED